MKRGSVVMGGNPQARWVYEFWSGDECLYVGQTGDALARLREHQRGSEFWPDVTQVKVTLVENSAAADATEIALIRSERPRHNTQGNPDHDPPRGPRKRVAA